MRMPLGQCRMEKISKKNMSEMNNNFEREKCKLKQMSQLGNEAEAGLLNCQIKQCHLFCGM